VLQEILSMMNTGGKSEGKVHYVRIEVSTALWGIMDVRVLRSVVGLLITVVSKERAALSSRVKDLVILIFDSPRRVIIALFLPDRYPF